MDFCDQIILKVGALYKFKLINVVQSKILKILNMDQDVIE
jgi:hypothetical protein